MMIGERVGGGAYLLRSRYEELLLNGPSGFDVLDRDERVSPSPVSPFRPAARGAICKVEGHLSWRHGHAMHVVASEEHLAERVRHVLDVLHLSRLRECDVGLPLQSGSSEHGASSS